MKQVIWYAHEVKMTDVNIAVEMLEAIRNRFTEKRVVGQSSAI